MNPVTTIVVNDPDLLARIATAKGEIVFRSPSGEDVQTVCTLPFGVPPPGFQSPISDDEMARRRLECTGRPLTEILRDLESRHGSS